MMRKIGLTLSMMGVVNAFMPRVPSSNVPTTKVFSTTAAPDMIGSKLTNNDLAIEAIGKFVKDKDYKMTPTSGGVNNIGQYITLSNGKKYVLRIYNNSGNRARVQWEHDILGALLKNDFSFQIPTPLPSLTDGKTYAALSNGADACMFEIIPGDLPKLTCVEDIGRASGELFQAISKVQLDRVSPTPPYYELYEVHHAIDRESFYREMNGPDFEHIRSAANEAVELIENMEKKLEKYLASDVRTCLIHGDLHYDNVLVQDGKVTGLLDFEFCARDWAPVELAVCLSKYAGEKEAMTYFDQFITGFTKHGRLSDSEIEMVPDLINLRILSNVVYFVGRALSKEDDISSITTRLENYLTRIRWVDSNSQVIIDNIKTKMAAAQASK